MDVDEDEDVRSRAKGARTAGGSAWNHTRVFSEGGLEGGPTTAGRSASRRGGPTGGHRSQGRPKQVSGFSQDQHDAFAHFVVVMFLMQKHQVLAPKSRRFKLVVHSRVFEDSESVYQSFQNPSLLTRMPDDEDCLRGVLGSVNAPDM